MYSSKFKEDSKVISNLFSDSGKDEDSDEKREE